MDQTYSAIQQQFPLSPRKFWKKVVSHFTGLVIFIVLLAIGDLAAYVLNGSEGLFLAISGILVVIIFIAVLSVIIYSLYIRAYILRYFYDTENDFITIKKGVFMPSEIHVQYGKIQDVYVDQDIWDRILGLYDVHIASATFSSGIAAHIDGVDKTGADGLKNLLLGKIRQGGISSPATPAPVSEKPATPDIQLSLNEQVNSTTYPISTRWLASKCIWTFLHNIWIFGLITFWIFAKVGADSGFSDNILFALMIGIVVAFVFTVFYFLYLLLWRRCFHFSFDEHYITMHQGVISKSEQHVPYKNIQDVRLTQSFIDRLLGLCSVYIENAVMTGFVSGASAASGINIANGIILPGLPLSKGQHLVDLVKSVLGKTPQNSTSGL